ncbi:MAG: hypothetical protein HYX79_07225, partial [Chloroflexi bacterium]|nr:hypothetical protein [Chloroflexota bacterium]
EMVIKLEEYGKGDIYYEICVERSSTENGVTITLWKRPDGHFQVASFDGDKWRALRGFNELKDKIQAWKAYEELCGAVRCSPYPKVGET